MTREQREALEQFRAILEAGIRVLRAKRAMLDRHGPEIARLVNEGRQDEAAALWDQIVGPRLVDYCREHGEQQRVLH